MCLVDRTRRVAALIKRELAHIITRELNDNRINCATITAVTVSRDLKRATVYVCARELIAQVEKADASETVLHEPATIESQLNHSAKYLRRRLSQNLDLRTTPALTFKYDHSIQRGTEIAHLIDQLMARGA